MVLAPERAPDDLRQRVRASVEGRRALVIGGHAGHELGEALRAQLGLEVSLCGTKRKDAETACLQIARSRYALVLLIHTTAIVEVPARRAAQRAGVLLVLVGRGRLGACVQALARELGFSGGR